MIFLKPIEDRMRRLSIIDFKLAQLAAMSVVLVIAKLLPDILTINLWWFIALALLFGIKPAVSFFFKQSV